MKPKQITSVFTLIFLLVFAQLYFYPINSNYPKKAIIFQDIIYPSKCNETSIYHMTNTWDDVLQSKGYDTYIYKYGFNSFEEDIPKVISNISKKCSKLILVFFGHGTYNNGIFRLHMGNKTYGHGILFNIPINLPTFIYMYACDSQYFSKKINYYPIKNIHYMPKDNQSVYRLKISTNTSTEVFCEESQLIAYFLNLSISLNEVFKSLIDNQTYNINQYTSLSRRNLDFIF